MTQENPRTSVSLARRSDRLLYAGIALSTLLQALFGEFKTDADTVAYLDISDAIRSHDWQHAINANWFPLFPALITAGRACFGFRPQYDLMAARLVNAADVLFFVLCAVLLADAARKLLVDRRVDGDRLLPARTLYLAVAIVAWFFASLDFTFIKPDALVSALMVLTLAATFCALRRNTLLDFAAIGLLAALAYWAKAFAFPFFVGLVLLTAVAHLKKPRVLAGLGLSVVVFAAFAGPYIFQISQLRGRFTYGEAGRLDMAWYVNNADRFNPVNDPEGWQPGSAMARFTHPGIVLFSNPRISYYGGPASFGSTPQWTDLSYWSDGLAPQFVLSDSIAEVRRDFIALVSLVPMRAQALVLVAALAWWGFICRRASFADPMIAGSILLGLGSIALYLPVYLEGRYIAFAFVIIFAVYAASAVTRPSELNDQALGAAMSINSTSSGRDFVSLHSAVILIACLMLVYALQSTAREAKVAAQQGARPLHGVVSPPAFAAGAALRGLYPQGGEVACVGDAACFGDTFWAHYGGVRVTAIVETGRGDRYLRDVKDAEQSCMKLEANSAALGALRERNVQAVVGFFNRTQPCASDWKTLGASSGYFLLPVQPQGIQASN